MHIPHNTADGLDKQKANQTQPKNKNQLKQSLFKQFRAHIPGVLLTVLPMQYTFYGPFKAWAESPSSVRVCTGSRVSELTLAASSGSPLLFSWGSDFPWPLKVSEKHSFSRACDGSFPCAMVRLWLQGTAWESCHSSRVGSSWLLPCPDYVLFAREEERGDLSIVSWSQILLVSSVAWYPSIL